MIITELSGGVGNQMFQYAIGYANAKRLKTRYYFYTRWYELSERRPEYISLRRFELDAFSLSTKPLPEKEWQLIQQGLLKFTTIQETPNPEGTRNFDPAIIANITKFTFLSGLWHTAKYFTGYEDALRKEFRFASPPTDPEIIKYTELIASKPNSVSLHVRLGDYVSLDWMNKIASGVCDTEYYHKAIQHIIDASSQPVNIFVFSDDIRNVKNHISFKHDVTLIETSAHIRSTESMRLMSLCDHNIIANSTFSWWGAWLNDNPEKIIIAPDPWFNVTDRMAEGAHIDTIPEGWVKIGKQRAEI